MPLFRIVALVDDDEEIRSAVNSLLRSHGVEMCAYETAEAFLDQANLEEIGCLITDLHMPGIGGLKLVGLLRLRGVAFPIIAMSARRSERAAAEARGADAYISKPFDGDELMGWLARLGRQA